MNSLPSQYRWKTRRGVKELDVLFERFIEKDYCDLTEPEKRSFIEILDQTDMQILDWLYQKQELPQGEIGTIIERLRNGNTITTQ